MGMQTEGLARTTRDDPHPIRDFFIGDLVDYAPKDSRDMMERPFFSLSKRKRNKAIEYENDDKSVYVRVTPHPSYGMATIWDADILIWCISRIMAERDRGKNNVERTIYTTPYELLKGIARGTSGADYRDLMSALRRLRNTEVETNIRAGRRKYAAFKWIEDTEGEGSSEDDPEQLKSMSLTVPRWLYNGLLTSGGVLTLDREYFLLTSGVERAIYRIARKHAGNQPDGWTCRMKTLHQKTGSEEVVRNFAVRIRKLALREGTEHQMPRYRATLTKTKDGSEAVHFVDRNLAALVVEMKQEKAATARRARIAAEDARARQVDRGGRFQQLSLVGLEEP
jgi:plasmid replication initiation protein